MTRKLTTLLIALALGWTAFANETAQSPLSPIRGFAGYEYQSGIFGIAADMETEGYTLIERTGSSLWYRSTFIGIDCELGYIFKDQLLIGGAFILKSATETDFAAVNNHLREIYKTKIEVEVEGGIIVATFKGPDSRITQTLDLQEQTHEVEYIREK